MRSWRVRRSWLPSDGIVDACAILWLRDPNIDIVEVVILLEAVRERVRWKGNKLCWPVGRLVPGTASTALHERLLHGNSPAQTHSSFFELLVACDKTK